MWSMHNVGWGWWLVVMLPFWALVIYGVFWLARSARSESPAESGRASPEQVLKRRLAAGEITVEEYEQLRDVLSEPEPDRREAALH